jgi:serine protease AprX
MSRARGVSWGSSRAKFAVGVLAGVAMAAAFVPPVAHATTTTDTTAATTATMRSIVRFQPGVDGSAIIARHGGTVVSTLSTLSSVIADVPVSGVEALRAEPGVVEVAEDAELQLVESSPETAPTSADVAAGRSNANQFVADDFGNADKGKSFDALTTAELAKIVGAEAAHESGVNGEGVDVALIDTGIAPVAGVGNVINGLDISFDSQFPVQHLDANGHGTHLAGIISGLAPQSRLLNVKVGAADGAVDVSQVIAAIDWVVQHRNDNGMNVRVLNLAYGTQTTQSYLIDPLAYAAEVAWKHGIVVVTAAGNGGTAAGRLTNPAINPYVLAVGASEAHGTYNTADDTVAAFSSRGDASRKVDLVAPGRSVVSHRVPGGYLDAHHPEGIISATQFRGSGTSQSAAVTSAAAALLLDQDPGLTPDQVKDKLVLSAKKLPKGGTGQGSGIIDVDKALKMPARAVVQTWPASTGTGSLEGARGTSHVEKDGVVLQGEIDIMGASWSGASWSGASWSGASWSGASWSSTSYAA